MAVAAASATPTTYDISITSDIVCPWCYIGHARLSKAIAKHSESYPADKFILTYKPFYLNPPPTFKSQQESLSSRDEATPAFPIESKPRREFYEKKFGAQRAQQIFQTLAQAGAASGLNFKFGGKTGHSRNGHRLVYYAQRRGGQESQNEVMLALWRRYFEQEIDITELEVLVDVGVEAKLGPREEIKQFLSSGEDANFVDSMAQDAASEYNVSGVPFYVLQHRYVVEGAQEPRAFENLFQRIKDIELHTTTSPDVTETKSDNVC